MTQFFLSSTTPSSQAMSFAREHKNFLQCATDYSFDPGAEKACIARKKTNSTTQLFPQAILYKMTRKDDASYWMRAFWQLAFGQIFASEDAFEEFFQKVSRTAASVPSQLHYQLGHVLLKLKEHKPYGKEFIEYLNHEEVDNTLCLYLQKVTLDYMKKEYQTRNRFNLLKEVFPKNEDNELLKITDPTHTEVIGSTFLEYFELEKYKVTLIKSENYCTLMHDDKPINENFFPKHTPVLLFREGCFTDERIRNEYLVMQIAPDPQEDAETAQALFDSFIFQGKLRKSLETAPKTTPTTPTTTPTPKPSIKTPKKIQPKKTPLPALCRFFAFLFEKCRYWLRKVFKKSTPIKKPLN